MGFGPNYWLAMLSQKFGRRRVLPRAAVGRTDAESWDMGHRILRPIMSRAPREAQQQCLIRDANEAIEVLNVALARDGRAP